MGRVREEKRRTKKIKKRKSQKIEDGGARKGRKVAKHSVFPMICGSGGSKSRFAKVAGAEPAGQVRDEKLRALVAKHISKSKCTKHPSLGALLEDAVVARSTIRSQNLQNTTCARHFWTLKRRFAWQTPGIVHLVKSEQNVRVL